MNLPYDVWFLIYQYLDRNDILNMRESCRHLKYMMDECVKDKCGYYFHYSPKQLTAYLSKLKPIFTDTSCYAKNLIKNRLGIVHYPTMNMIYSVKDIFGNYHFSKNNKFIISDNDTKHTNIIPVFEICVLNINCPKNILFACCNDNKSKYAVDKIVYDDGINKIKQSINITSKIHPYFVVSTNIQKFCQSIYYVVYHDRIYFARAPVVIACTSIEEIIKGNGAIIASYVMDMNDFIECSIIKDYIRYQKSGQFRSRSDEFVYEQDLIDSSTYNFYDWCEERTASSQDFKNKLPFYGEYRKCSNYAFYIYNDPVIKSELKAILPNKTQSKYDIARNIMDLFIGGCQNLNKINKYLTAFDINLSHILYGDIITPILVKHRKCFTYRDLYLMLENAK